MELPPSTPPAAKGATSIQTVLPSGQIPIPSSVPTIVSTHDGDALAKLKKRITQAFNDLKKVRKFPKNWVSEMTDLALLGIALKDPERMLDLARHLQRDLGYTMPTTGAFWSGKDTGQVQARGALGSSGKVLADTDLGKDVAKWGVAPQGAKFKSNTVDETLEAFQERNAAALLFWGALSALYAEGLTGEVHVWLPKGLTMSSIFWNDELPMLHAKLRAKTITALKFHVQASNGAWSKDMELDELTIVDAYLADAQGVNKGAEALVKDQKNPATIDYKSYQITLAKPIHVDLLQAGFRQALQRTRARKLAAAIKEGAKRAQMPKELTK